MSIKNKAYIVGIYEHPTRKAEDKSLNCMPSRPKEQSRTPA